MMTFAGSSLHSPHGFRILIPNFKDDLNSMSLGWPARQKNSTASHDFYYFIFDAMLTLIVMPESSLYLLLRASPSAPAPTGTNIREHGHYFTNRPLVSRHTFNKALDTTSTQNYF